MTYNEAFPGLVLMKGQIDGGRKERYGRVLLS